MEPALEALGRLVQRLAAGEPGPVEPVPGDRVRGHKLAPLAYRAGYQEFRADFVAAAMLAELREKLLGEAIAALAAARVPVILLKGISYCRTIYDDPGERPLGDIDLMVPPDRHPAAAAALAALGYRDISSAVSRSHLHHAVTLKRQESNIDLHRTIIQPLRSRIDLAAVWARAEPAAERSDGALRLDPVDEALFHLIHIGRHELMVPAINYIDAGRLLGRLSLSERQQLHSRASAFRLGRAIRAATSMTKALTTGVEPWDRLVRRLLPDRAEVLSARRVPRALQFARKAFLLEGLRQLGGAAVVFIEERIASTLPGPSSPG